MSAETVVSDEEGKLSRLVDLERELADKRPSPDESSEDDGADRPFLSGTVVDADRKGDEAVVRFRLADDSEHTATVRWPEYDDPDEPLARVLETVNLGLDEFANIIHESIPILRTGEDTYEIDVPPSSWRG